MDKELLKALTVIMPVLDDYQSENIQDDTVGLFEDREFTAAYKILKARFDQAFFDPNFSITDR